MRAVGARAVAVEPLEAGWSLLRAFFSEGHPALERALEALRAAEGRVRASGDPARLTLWLLGISTALRYTRRPEPMETALERARELVNVVARAQGDAATIPYRTLVEATYRDLADVVPARADAALAAGLAFSDRTMRLARRIRRDEYLAAASASRGDLIVRHDPGDRRAVRRAVALHEEARRRWPPRDPCGRAVAGVGYAGALLAAREAARAELVARDALAVFRQQGDRYHEAAAHLVLARALLRQDRPEALDEQAAAADLFRALGCRWELRRAEGALG
ncbi:MAG: hypothetical protein QN168_12655 [Armatimonadota bacterium]|nr:hypothetical protein [Armatimonadota bacterium]